MTSLKALVVFASLSLGAVLPRTPAAYIPPGACCFTLHDSKTGDTIQQDKTNGNVYLNADQPDGWYCIDLSNSADILLDHLNNACIISIENRFLCLDPTPGAVAWSLKQSSSSVLLAHDGATNYEACPYTTGGEELWGSNKKSSGCRSLSLKAQGFEGTCNGLSG